MDSLHGLIEHEHPLDSTTTYNFLRQALFNCKDPNRLLSEFDKLCHTKPKSEKYVLITCIQLKGVYHLPTTSFHDCKIRLVNQLPKKYAAARQKILASITESTEIETGLTYAVISNTAKSAESAVDKATDAFSILSGLLQLGFKKSVNFLALRDEDKYPSRLVIDQCKILTLHLSNGRAHAEPAWTNTDYQERKPATLRNPKNTVTHTNKRRAQLKRLPFRSHIEKCLINYSSALSSKNPELRFLKLWVALEQLLDTDDTDTLIKRTSFFYSEKDAQKAILRSLRLARNNHVHGGKPPPNIHLKIFQLCQHLEHALLFFISNPFNYRTTEEITNFISISTEADNIQGQIKRLKAALKFIS
ncbi:HEPN domain-containing protein [Pseudomonas sp. LLC-1]|uniref:HEPN domain-containing protein n=1 Tax=Pseudomonas sp. LLC-1 TaxID=1812180 RepID=UPI0011B756FE|nr:HEPN domain-containing protein [Pseudomonas sp. LLC-1]